MALYRPHEVNCGHCNEPQDTRVDDFNGAVYTDGVLTLTVDPCMRCEVHAYGDRDRCDDDCPECAENDGEGDA
ncbi:hypothetical protein ACWD2L_00610 [Streptomyces sp. NPDC002754]